MFNFCDTETSDPKHQRVCQLAAVLCDEKGQELEVINYLIKPDGWEIAKRFVEIHGITTQMCHERGIPMKHALAHLNSFVERSKKVICHNYKFDSARLMNEFNIYGIPTKMFELPSFCTMMELTSVCKIPHANGRAGYKWPKLQEAHKHFFGVEFEDDHDALADTRACKRIYFHMNAPALDNPIVPSAEGTIKPDEMDSVGSI